MYFDILSNFLKEQLQVHCKISFSKSVALIQLPYAMLRSNLAVSEGDGLAELLKTNSHEAFARLYDWYAGPLYGFICRTTPDAARAEALLQQVFVRAWRDIAHYDPSKEGLFTWLFRHTLDACGRTTETIKALKVVTSFPLQ
jgi:Sigma-70 region 2